VNPISASHQPRFLKLFFPEAMHVPDNASLVVNNLGDVYPDKINTKGDFEADLGGRFEYPWEVNQFGFTGMTILSGLTVRF